MKEKEIALNPHKIAKYLGKLPEEFTKEDIIKYIEENSVKMVNFRYVGGDGRLKTLNFAINCKSQLDRILSIGERVDGSSLFSYVDAGSSDLYVVPRYKTAYVNPFSEAPTIDILCSFYNSEGQRLTSAPEQILHAANESLKNTTGLSLEAMGELEYYVFYDVQSLYPGTVRKGYHESHPFSKGEKLRIEAMEAISLAGGKIKYGHSEVGYIQAKNNYMEQHEIEFLPVPAEEAAEQIIIAKWMLRKIAYNHGLTVSFAPKISFGHAGSGLHIHTKLVKEGKNILVEKGQISETARRIIAGYLSLASSLTAFGNKVPVSYLRLVPHQEAPTNICWGERNRSSLVRVPLGWLHKTDMAKDANPLEKTSFSGSEAFQTVEYRGADGSADVYLLIAGLAVAARHGIEMKESLNLAESLCVDVNIFNPKHKSILDKLPNLPMSCMESAECLLKDRLIYEKDHVFPPLVIDEIAKHLMSYNDKGLSEELYGKEDDIKKLVDKFIHC